MSATIRLAGPGHLAYPCHCAPGVSPHRVVWVVEYEPGWPGWPGAKVELYACPRTLESVLARALGEPPHV